jgi:hypothetical protein
MLATGLTVLAAISLLLAGFAAFVALFVGDFRDPKAVAWLLSPVVVIALITAAAVARRNERWLRSNVLLVLLSVPPLYIMLLILRELAA